MVIENTEELIALSKALKFLRFECKEYEAKCFAGSPILGKIYKQLTEDLTNYYVKIGAKSNEKWPIIDSLPHYIETIKEHIKNTDSWSDLTKETKNSAVRAFVFPYEYNDVIIDELVLFGDRYHNKS